MTISGQDVFECSQGLALGLVFGVFLAVSAVLAFADEGGPRPIREPQHEPSVLAVGSTG